MDIFKLKNIRFTNEMMIFGKYEIQSNNTTTHCTLGIFILLAKRVFRTEI